MKILKGCNSMYPDGNHIQLFKDSVIISSGHSFYGKDAEEALEKSMNYWRRFFVRLEYDLKTVLVKPRHQNIKMVLCHVAKTNDKFARYCEDEPIKVCGEDGKVWLLVDNSFNLKELETIHPDTSVPDMQEIVSPFFNDLKEDHFKLSQLSQFMVQTNRNICAIAETSKQNALAINSILAVLRSGEERKKEPTPEGHARYVL